MTHQEYNIACIGECMVEIAMLRDHASQAKVGYGGDTLNTALYLARLGEGTAINTYYVTSLGDDPFSYDMRKSWQDEDICCDHVEHITGREAGLYSISVDAQGERSFNYWRSNAPVKEIFDGDAGFLRLRQLRDMEAIFFSGITLAVLTDESCKRLLDFCVEMKKMGRAVIFDTNFRARLWAGRNPAAIYEKAFKTATTILPSYEDLIGVFRWDEADCKAALEKYEVTEIVLKDGGQSIDLYGDHKWQKVKLKKVDTPVDTTAAGDSFNAGYIFASLSDNPPSEAVQFAHNLACQVINFPGAIIPKSEMPTANVQEKD